MKTVFTSLLLLALVWSPAHAQTNVTIGAGALSTVSANSATGDPGPMYRASSTNTLRYSAHHYLYTQAEMQAAGIPANSLITKLAWYKDVNTASNVNFLFQIWGRNSSRTTVLTPPQTLANLTSGATLAYNNTATSLSSAIGFVEFTLTNPILYTGGALEITVNFAMSTGSSPWTTGGLNWKKDNISNRTISYCASAASTSLGNARTVRPQIRITHMPSTCSGTPNTTSVTGETGVCSGSVFTLTATGRSRGLGYAYKWQSRIAGTGAFADVPGATDTFLVASKNVTAIQTMEYRFVTICNGSGISSNSNTHSVTIAPPPEVTGMTHTFSGPTYTFTGTGVQHASTYYWEYGDGNSGSSNVHTYSMGTLYNVKLVVGNVCSTDTVVTPVMVMIPCTHAVAGTVPATTSLICEKDMITFQPQGYFFSYDIAYQWQSRLAGSSLPFADIPGATDVDFAFSATEPMEYRMKTTCMANNFTDYTNVVMLPVNQIPNITDPADITVNQFDDASFTVNSPGNVAYRWQSAFDNGEFLSIADNGVYDGVSRRTLTVKQAAYAQSGLRFRCIVTDISGCGFSDDTSGHSILSVFNTQSIDDRSKLSDITLYPNPAQDKVYIKTTAGKGQQFEITLMDNAGRTVWTDSITLAGSTPIDVSKLPAGQYTLQLNDVSGIPTGNIRFTKQ